MMMTAAASVRKHSQPGQTSQWDPFRALLVVLREDYLNEIQELPPKSSPEPLDLVIVSRRGFLRRRIEQIDEALARIADGTYGRCRECRLAIPTVRLKVRPFDGICRFCVKPAGEEPQAGVDVTTGSPHDPVRRARVVVGVDDSPAARVALRYAFVAAAHRHAALDIVTAYPVSLPWAWDATLDTPDVDAMREAMNRGAEEQRSSVHGDVPAVADVPVRVLVGRGSPAEVLVEESGRADLLVVGSRGRGAARSALFGSVALHCVTAAQCPVVVVHESAVDASSQEAVAGPGQAPRVVVGVDGSPDSRAALVAALGEAATRGAVLEAVAAYSLGEFRTDRGRAPRPTDEEVSAQVRGRLTATVDAARADLPAAVRSQLSGVRTLVVGGQPADVLLEQARGAQLLVVGGRRHSALRGLMHGSVALNCVLRGRCPVMVVHAAPAPATATMTVAEPTPA
jgi:nucleotide-binding universal stress UspA family protein